jgi:hypothetical protein
MKAIVACWTQRSDWRRYTSQADAITASVPSASFASNSQTFLTSAVGTHRGHKRHYGDSPSTYRAEAQCVAKLDGDEQERGYGAERQSRDMRRAPFQSSARLGGVLE